MVLPRGMAQRSAHDASIQGVIAELGTDVLRDRYSLEEDWTGDPSVTAATRNKENGKKGLGLEPSFLPMICPIKLSIWHPESGQSLSKPISGEP